MRAGAVIAGRFQLEASVGRGATGRVYRARDLESGDRVAVKVLFAGGDSRDGRFAREVAALAALRHPCLVRYLAHGATDDAEPWLAMEWVEGETLRSRLAHGVGIPAAVDLVRRVADALGVVHAHGLVHRDLKPDNVMVDGPAFEQVKVLDFGVVRHAGSGMTLTGTGGIVGTPAYMAPEQARGEPVDQRADVFALGAVLFQCLTGTTPFVSDTIHAMLLKIVLDDAPPPSTLRPEVNGDLDGLVSRMLAKDPALRPRDGAEVAAALAAVDVGDASGPGPASSAVPEITGAERRVQAFVLARPAAEGREDATDTGTVLLAAGRDGPATLAELVTPFGGSPHVLADGSVLVTIGGAGASELALSAARCAAVLHARWPEAPMVLAFGHAEGPAAQPLGEAIDRAVRLLDAEVQGRVRVAPEMTGALEARFELGVDERGAFLRGERAEALAGRTLLGRPTPCVGRDQELAVLAASLATCIDEGSARALLVTAPAGLGKSRLRAEFLHRVGSEHGAGVAVWTAQGDPISAGSPLGMLGRMVRVEAEVRQGEPAAAAEARLRARVARHVAAADVARVTGFLAQLAGIPLASPPGVELAAARANPVLMADEMRAAWEDFVRAEATARPLLLLFEDLHCADVATVRFVDGMLRALAELPIFVFALARPEVTDLFPKLWAGHHLQTVALREIGAKASERLVRHALGGAVSEGALRRIVEHAGGNPFFLEELVRAEAAGQGGALPDTVLATVESRLAALDPEARRILRAGSVFGRAFWRGGLLALLGERARASADGWLGVLEDAELLVRRASNRFPGEVELVFRHALVRDAAYAMLPEADRAVGHRLAADWLEAAGETDPNALAEHLVRGGEPDRAIVLYGRASEAALDANDFEGAVALAERAVASGARGEVLGALRVIQAEARRWSNETAGARAAAEEALALLPEGSGPWYRAADQIALILRGHEDLPRLAELAARLDTPLEGEHVGAHLAAASHLVWMMTTAGGRQAAKPLADRLSALDPMALDLTSRAHLLRHRRVVARTLGDLSADIRACVASRDAFAALGDHRYACFDELHLSSVLLGVGCFEAAEASTARAEAIAARLGLPRLLASAHLNRGFALAHLGRAAEGRAWIEKTEAVFADDQRMGGGSKAYLSIVLAIEGRLDAAAEAAEVALERLGGSPLAALALAVAAQIALARGQVADALPLAERAAALLVSQGGLEEGEERVRLAHAEALDAAGRAADAAAALAEAERRVLERAARIDDPSIRASYLERVPVNARTLALARARRGSV